MATLTLKRKFLRLVSRSVPLTVLGFLADDFLARWGMADANPGQSEHLSGADADRDIAYAKGVVANYAAQAALTGTVAEIGPGGSAATGLFLIARGAEHVDMLDRFVFSHDQAHLQRTYAKIIDADPHLRNLFHDYAINKRISFVSGEEAAAEKFFASRPIAYDTICSCAVLEHVSDPLEVIEAASWSLKPGGTQVHYVDFRDHGMFTAGGHHALTFLRIPQAIYYYMSNRRGRPNRVLVDRYRELLAALPLNWEICVTSLAGVGAVEHLPYDQLSEAHRHAAEIYVEHIKPTLAARFRELPSKDLAIEGIRIVATRRD